MRYQNGRLYQKDGQNLDWRYFDFEWEIYGLGWGFFFITTGLCFVFHKHIPLSSFFFFFPIFESLFGCGIEGEI
jgi:hypothetical protein